MALIAGIAAVAGLVAGFLAGFGFAKRSRQWCPGCGLTMTVDHCPHPIPATPPPLGRPAVGASSPQSSAL